MEDHTSKRRNRQSPNTQRNLVGQLVLTTQIDTWGRSEKSKTGDFLWVGWMVKLRGKCRAKVPCPAVTPCPGVGYATAEARWALGKQEELAECPPAREALENEAACPQMWHTYQRWWQLQPTLLKHPLCAGHPSKHFTFNLDSHPTVKMRKLRPREAPARRVPQLLRAELRFQAGPSTLRTCQLVPVSGQMNILIWLVE